MAQLLLYTDRKMSILKEHSLFVKEKAFRFFNQYEIFDSSNRKIGHVQEARKFLKKLIGKFELDFYDGERIVVRAKKPFSIIRPKVYIYDANDVFLGYFVKKIIAFRPRFYVYDANDVQIGMLEGDFIGWNFALHDKKEQMVVDVNKKFAGILKEAFTTADSYRMHFMESKTVDRRIALAVPFMVDILLKERRRSSGMRHTYFRD